MPDPEGRWTSAYVPEVERLGSIRPPCLILIGEPGAGCRASKSSRRVAAYGVSRRLCDKPEASRLDGLSALALYEGRVALEETGQPSS